MIPKMVAASRDGLPLAFKIISPIFIFVAIGIIGTAVYQWFHLIMPMYGPPYTVFYFTSTIPARPQQGVLRICFALLCPPFLS